MAPFSLSLPEEDGAVVTCVHATCMKGYQWFDQHAKQHAHWTSTLPMTMHPNVLCAQVNIITQCNLHEVKVDMAMYCNVVY